jgi:ankyrin repeat protein
MTNISNLNLESAKARAKTLLKSLKVEDAAAVSLAKSNGIDPQTAKLADALHLIAVQNGASSWPDLKAKIELAEAQKLGLDALVLQLVGDNQESAHPLAKPLLTEAKNSFAFACAVHDFEAIRAHLKAGADVNAKLPGVGLEPILVVTRSKWPGRRAAKAAKLLIDAGADLSASWFHMGWPTSPLTSLYAAAGIRRDPELTLLLLKSGIDPNDNESVYHATETSDTTILRILLENGATATKTNALNHQLDTDRVEGLQILLKAGAQPDEEGYAPALHWAIKRGRSRKILEMLIEAGADISREFHGATPNTLAILSGHKEAAELLGELGGPISKAAQAMLDLRAGKNPPKLDPAELSPSEIECLSFAASQGEAERVRELVQLGWPLEGMSYHDGTPLHWACWHGHYEAAMALVEAGSDLTIKDPRFQAQPLGWVCHGSVNCNPRKGDYPRLAERLLASGAPIFEPTNQTTARPDVLKVVKAWWKKSQESA